MSLPSRKRAAVEFWLSHLRARHMPNDASRQELSVLLALYYNNWRFKADCDLTREDWDQVFTAYDSLLDFMNRYWRQISEANGPDLVVECFLD